MLFHQRNAHKEKEGQDTDGANDGPPIGGVGSEGEEEEAPPERYLAKVIGMSGIGPEARRNGLAAFFAGAPEVAHLEVGGCLDNDGSSSDDGGGGIQPGERARPAGERRPQGQAA